MRPGCQITLSTLTDLGSGCAAPVVSSCDVEVLPLDVAQTMTPRPPSPTRRAQIQKKQYAGRDPNKLSNKDATILMELAPGSPLMNGEDLYSSVSKRPSLAPDGTRKVSTTSTSSVATAKEEKAPLVVRDLLPQSGCLRR